MTAVTATSILSSRHALDPSKRIDTLLLRYPRCIHAEFMTHRMFCLAGDARLDFEMPAGSRGNRRVYSMTLREFADKWFNGARESVPSRHNGLFLDDLDWARAYSAKEIAEKLGYKSCLNLNQACREGLVLGALKEYRGWVALGAAWREWRAATGKRRFSLRSRLAQMQIRQVDETNGAVRLSNVSDCVMSGVRPVYRVSAGAFSVVATQDHRILTAAGWKRLSDIVPGSDSICCYQYGAGVSPDPYRKIDGRWVCAWARQVKGEVYSRQNGVCAHSGDPLGASFDIHHILPRHERPDLAFDVNNVIAVTPDAHRELHADQGWQVGVPLGSSFETVDSIEPEGEQDTYDLEIAGEFPNFFADGVVVHNSRNAASSRAIPVEKMIQSVLDDPFVPLHWGKNQKGMQADEECDEPVTDTDEQAWPLARSDAWLRARDEAVEWARAFAYAGYHKQIVNRLLEPWMHITVVATSSNWSNFLHLRDHEDAEPHIHILAQRVREALDGAEVQTLEPGDWHLPFVTDDDWWYVRPDVVEGGDGYAPSQARELMLKLSVARCASTSYKTVDDFDMTLERAIEIHDKLVGSDPLHASPCEHQAQADTRVPVPGAWEGYGPTEWKSPEQGGNLGPGWIQYRKTLKGECR